jgi:hypothetical protein
MKLTKSKLKQLIREELAKTSIEQKGATKEDIRRLWVVVSNLAIEQGKLAQRIGDLKQGN